MERFVAVILLDLSRHRDRNLSYIELCTHEHRQVGTRKPETQSSCLTEANPELYETRLRREPPF